MKEENIKGEYQRKVDKSLIPTCNIMGVNIAAINMNWLLKYIDENLSDLLPWSDSIPDICKMKNKKEH